MNIPFQRSKRRALALMTVAALVAVGCGRDSDSQAADDEDVDGGGRAEQAGDDGQVDGDGNPRLHAGEFGDLGVVCQDGDASGDSDTGVSDDTITVGTITDKSFEVRDELNKEMWDTAVAFTEWCNAHGGINGRQIDLVDLDTLGTEYPDRIAEACNDNFALVGGGAVFDSADRREGEDQSQREQCGLANIPGFVVTPGARAAGVQVQPLPNPVQQFPAQQYARIRELNPEIDRLGIIWVDFDGPRTIAEQVRETALDNGYKIAYDKQAQPMGETGWETFVRQMRDEDVQVVEYVGEPEQMSDLLNAMEVQGWYPEYVFGQPNMYDDLLVEEAGSSLGDGVVVRNVFPPYETNGDVEAIGDYRDLMETYNNDGKWPAMLGMQALSSWLLFAQAATECGDDLTRDCLLENAFDIEDWTAGGLHGTTNPGNVEAGRCGVMLRVTADGILYDEELTDPNEGIYNCSDDNVAQLTGDYGVEAPPR